MNIHPVWELYNRRDPCPGFSCLIVCASHCCHIGTAIKHLVPDRIKPLFVIFDNWAL